MTNKEAWQIFKDWQAFAEINDKLSTLFLILPEAFLPHPVKILEEALNIVAKSYFDTGDKKASKSVQESSILLTKYSDDLRPTPEGKTRNEAVINWMNEELVMMLENPDLMEAKLGALTNQEENWIKFKNKNL